MCPDTTVTLKPAKRPAEKIYHNHRANPKKKNEAPEAATSGADLIRS
jgi:hypothetical protein